MFVGRVDHDLICDFKSGLFDIFFIILGIIMIIRGKLIIGLVSLSMIIVSGCIRVMPKETAGVEEQVSDSVAIAMCQIFCLDGDREGNFVRIENALKKAVAAGAEVACFPETALLGWVNPDAHQRALAIPGADSERLCGLAARYGVYLCIGLAEKEGDKLYDTALLIDDNGEILLKHRKINIMQGLMTPGYTPGDSVRAVDTELGRMGVLICADTFDDKILEKMRAQRPEILLVPYGWAAREEQWPGHGKALENTVVRAAQAVGCPLVGTDLVGAISQGPWQKMVYGGQSIAVDAEGQVLGRCCDRDWDVQLVRVRRSKR